MEEMAPVSDSDPHTHKEQRVDVVDDKEKDRTQKIVDLENIMVDMDFLDFLGRNLDKHHPLTNTNSSNTNTRDRERAERESNCLAGTYTYRH